MTKDVIVPVAAYDMQHYDVVLQSYFSLKANQLKNALNLFVGKPYLLEPLGEGKEARYSQEPMYRTDKFDCVSYVNTVLSLCKATDLAQFQKNMLLARYGSFSPSYVARTDWFTELEWLPNLQRLGWIKTVMMEAPVAVARTIIDKPNWYRVKPLKALHRFPPVPTGEEAFTLLHSLQQESLTHSFTSQPAEITYFQLSELFASDFSLFQHMPGCALIIIVRPDWPIKDKFPDYPRGYGTNLNVSHLGIAIREKDEMMFYHASSIEGSVKRESLIHYLQGYLNHPTVKGIHVQEIIT